MAAQIDILQLFGEDLILRITQTLADPNSLHQLLAYQNRLLAITHQLRAINERDRVLSSKYSSYLSQLSQTIDSSLSAMKGITTSIAGLANDYSTIVQDLFILEHEIMDFLSGGLTRTAKYAIYYDAEVGSGTFTRGEISAEELYKSGALSVSQSGINLSRSSVIELFKTRGTTSTHSTSSSVYTQLAQELLKRSESLYQNLEKTKTAIEQKMREAEREILDDDLRTHMGERKWNQYNRWKKLRQSKNGLSSIMSRLMLQQSWASLRGLPYNRGHMVEAFERFLSEGYNVDPTGAEIGQLFEESLGNLPWFAGADVLKTQTQVKSLFSTLGDHDTKVQVASTESILALANELLQLLTFRYQWINSLPQGVRTKVISQLKASGVNAKATAVRDQSAQLIADKLANQAFGKK